MINTYEKVRADGNCNMLNPQEILNTCLISSGEVCDELQVEGNFLKKTSCQKGCHDIGM